MTQDVNVEKREPKHTRRCKGESWAITSLLVCVKLQLEYTNAEYIVMPEAKV